VAPLDEFGVFVPVLDRSPVSGVDHASTDFIPGQPARKGVLFGIEKIPTQYPHCWRCKTEVLFRLIDEWFIGMSWREEIMKVCHDIRWIPGSACSAARLAEEHGRLDDLEEALLGPRLPIWVDEKSGDFEVIGSRAELQARAVEGWDKFAGHTPHRPWIDLVKDPHPKTGNLMSRIPDVGNPWLDAGIVPYSTMGYNRDRETWKEWFPADFITECFPASSATGSTPCWP